MLIRLEFGLSADGSCSSNNNIPSVLLQWGQGGGTLPLPLRGRVAFSINSQLKRNVTNAGK